MANIFTKSETKWIDWRDARIQIRSYPNDRIVSHKDPEKVSIQDLQVFMYCIVGWENINVDGEELECNSTNKKNAYKHNMSLRNAVTEGVVGFIADEEDIKN